MYILKFKMIVSNSKCIVHMYCNAKACSYLFIIHVQEWLNKAYLSKEFTLRKEDNTLFCQSWRAGQTSGISRAWTDFSQFPVSQHIGVHQMHVHLGGLTFERILYGIDALCIFVSLSR